MSSKNVTSEVVSVDEQAFEKADGAAVDEDGFEVVDETPESRATVQMEVQAKVDANHPDGMVDTARVEQSRVANAYKTLNTELGLPTQPVRASEFIPRLASELGISDAIRRRAVALSKHHQETAISNGCRPSGVAAACIYKAAQEHGRSLTQQRVADAAGMSAVTVRARRDELNAA